MTLRENNDGLFDLAIDVVIDLGFLLEEVALLRLHGDLEIGFHLGQLFVQLLELRRAGTK